MNIKDIIRAWKDSTYRNSLSEEQRAMLPSSPIGDTLTEEELQAITGGAGGGGCDTDANGICSCTGSPYCTDTSLCTGGPWCY